MTIYYCHSCVVSEGLVTPIDPAIVNLSGTPYQLDKYLKHTAPAPGSGFVSTYNNADFDAYRDYTITPSLSGCCEIDDLGRKNILWFAGDHIGVTNYDGVYQTQVDTVKLVLSDFDDRVHSYPVLSGTNLSTQTCCKCGRTLIA